MTARNDITGDQIKTKTSNEKYDEGWDRIFKKKAEHLVECNADHTKPIGCKMCICKEQAIVTDEMVSRFLTWKLPQNFSPDAGISFKRVYNENSPFGPMNHEPTGTNLLDANQARQMLEHVLGVEKRVCKFPTKV